MQDTITIKGARLHNLKNITISIPKYKLVAFTGLSGSGKSTLAFDTLHKEGQRQYMESLGMVTDNLSKPSVESISGLSPSISVDQRLANRSPRSTVGTVTEVFTYLRVLYARLGHRTCASCGADVPPSHEADDDDSDADGRSYPCPACGAPVPAMGMASFSFNKPAGACPTCTGLGVVHEARLEELVDSDRSVADGAVRGWDAFFITHNSRTLTAAARHYGFAFDLSLPVRKLGPVQRDLLLYGVDSPRFRRRFPQARVPDTARNGRFEGIVTNILRRYTEHANDPAYREKMERLLSQRTCPDCDGARLRPESRRVTVAGASIVDVQRLPLAGLAAWLQDLEAGLDQDARIIAAPILADLAHRVGRLVDVGVGYVSLERGTPTLSAGETQRLRLAALLGSGLTGVLYVLDEPTIGLHPRDTGTLIRTLRGLRDLGNTVLVVEHDMEMLRAADFIVDVGPGAGRSGGGVVVAGDPARVAACPDSVTGGHLSGRLSLPVPLKRRKGSGGFLTIHGAREHNLKNLTVRIPLGALVAITGASGSGKSSLILDILDRAGRRRFSGSSDQPGEHDSITGWEHLDQMVAIDQGAIGRTPRSNAATYTDAFTPIRDAFASVPEARGAGLTARDFSLDVPGGRCERCEGAGVLSVEMHFLPDVQVRCPSCRGRRFTRGVLAVRYREHDIAQVLDLTIEEALPLFDGVPAAASRLALMSDVGLGYLRLGQPATTLSGGEAQRVKLAKELGRRTNGRTLYLLDEPTTGLHPADVGRLMRVLQRLVDAGSSVIVIEHNLDVIKAADWIIDMGPGGGDAGGRVVAEGTPERVAGSRSSCTGPFLAPLLA